MYAVRLLIILLLGLAVPAFGYAAVAVVRTPCTVERASIASVSNSPVPAASATHAVTSTSGLRATQSHDCCDDEADGQLGSNSSCKPGQACHGAQVVAPATAIILPGLELARILAAERPASCVACVWAAFWRPPRLV
jgi:hypothetical protein